MLLMGPDLELDKNVKGKMETWDSKEKTSSTQASEEKISHCVRNFDDKLLGAENLCAEQTAMPESENVELNIIDCTNDVDGGPVENECFDATENSSSFGDTLSNRENGSLLDENDEVESHPCDDNAWDPIYGGYFDEFNTRKKLTAHWRKFIHPLMWRCKWVELQIKKLQSQAQKYDSELKSYDQTKWFDLEKLTMEGSNAKSIPFSSPFRRNKVLRRRKRKKVEETTEIASYMSHHNLFSYYEKRSLSNEVFVEEECRNPDKTDLRFSELEDAEKWSSLNWGDDDSFEEHILSKIELAQTQVQKLKNRIEKVVSENPKKFSSINMLTFLAPSDHPAALENGNRLPIRLYEACQQAPERNLDDLLVPENVASSHAEVTLLSDTSEMTEKRQAGVSCKQPENDILIPNRFAGREQFSFGNVGDLLVDRPQAPARGQRSIPPVPASGANLASKAKETNDKSAVKAVASPKSTGPRKVRKRGRKRSRLSR